MKQQSLPVTDDELLALIQRYMTTQTVAAEANEKHIEAHHALIDGLRSRGLKGISL